MKTAAVADRFLVLRDQLTHARVGDGARDVATALTTALDDVIAELAATVTGEPVAVVAVGGYGRQDLCLRSDVDLMVLHDGADLEAVIGAVLYPLWDADLRVGHSVRTLDEAVRTASESFETLTALLGMRRLAGDPGLVATLEGRIADLVRARPFAPRLADSEQERRRRDPYPVMAADVKNGRGGLRTYQGFDWERRRADLLELPHPHTADAAETAGFGTLLAVRNALHAAAGRAVDRFSVDLRSPAARWLGVDVEDLAAMMCDAVALGDRLAERRWGDLIPGADPMVAFGRKVLGRVTGRFRNGELPGDGSPLGVALASVSRPEGVWLSSVERDQVRSAVSNPEPWSDGDRRALVTLLSAGERGRAAWDLLAELGWVEGILPEWSTVAHRPQLAPFHEHPVGAHLWRTVDEMWNLCMSSGEYRRVADEVGSSEELLLAALLHDIGKGSGKDHSVAGAAAAARFCAAAGFGPATTAVLVTAVRHHLVLSHAATRQDTDDPDVVEGVAALVGDRRSLQVLYLLTVADARATGATMWTPWKAALLRRVYDRTLQVFDDDLERPHEARFAAALHAASQRHPRRLAEEHLVAMPSDYLLETAAEDVAWHLDVVQRSGVGSPTQRVVVAVRPEQGLDHVVVAGPDRPGLLGAVATVFAVHGAAVMGAKIHVRRDGAVVGVFHVVNDRGGGSVSPERWERIERDLTGVVIGDGDLSADLERRAAAYDRGVRSVPSRVSVRPADSRRATVVEVRCSDRIGRLAQIVDALYTQDLDIRWATLDTRADEVIDVFHVLLDERPLTEVARRRVETSLRVMFGGDGTAGNTDAR